MSVTQVTWAQLAVTWMRTRKVSSCGSRRAPDAGSQQSTDSAMRPAAPPRQGRGCNERHGQASRCCAHHCLRPRQRHARAWLHACRHQLALQRGWLRDCLEKPDRKREARAQEPVQLAAYQTQALLLSLPLRLQQFCDSDRNSNSDQLQLGSIALYCQAWALLWKVMHLHA